MALCGSHEVSILVHIELQGKNIVSAPQFVPVLDMVSGAIIFSSFLSLSNTAMLANLVKRLPLLNLRPTLGALLL